MLTNQLYALEPATFAVPGDPKTRGRRFADEAERILEQESNLPSITLIQGIYALFVYEGNLGKGSKSVDYFLRSINMFNALNNGNLLQPRGDIVDEVRLQR